MNPFGTLMLIFAISVLLVGIYMFTGHKIGLLSLRPAFKNLSIEGWKKVGKWTMISSIGIFVIAIVLLILDID